MYRLLLFSGSSLNITCVVHVRLTTKVNYEIPRWMQRDKITSDTVKTESANKHRVDKNKQNT